jgi:hypothetical protein
MEKLKGKTYEKTLKTLMLIAIIAMGIKSI